MEVLARTKSGEHEQQRMMQHGRCGCEPQKVTVMLRWICLPGRFRSDPRLYSNREFGRELLVEILLLLLPDESFMNRDV